MEIELFKTTLKTIELNIRFIQNNCINHGFNIPFANKQVRNRFILELEEIINEAQDAIAILKQADGE